MAKPYKQPQRTKPRNKSVGSYLAIVCLFVFPALLILALTGTNPSGGFFSKFIEKAQVLIPPPSDSKIEAELTEVPTASEEMASEENSWKQLNDKPWKPPRYELTVLAEGLSGPGGLVALPENGTILVSEEYANRITAVTLDGTKTIWASTETPIYTEGQKAGPLLPSMRSPEGVALCGDGTLYVAEDYPGGRLLRFFEGEDGKAAYGQEIHIPGGWSHVAWEDIDVSDSGKLLLAGSDAESLQQRNKSDFFSGTILYRDERGDWWSPYNRIFSSFSTVSFSKSGEQALYTCELTGEMGWIDLRQKTQQGGFCAKLFKTPEALCLTPDGSVLIGEESGKIYSYDPALDQSKPLPQPIDHIEALSWDPYRSGVLVADDAAGRILFMRPQTTPDPKQDRMKLARYEAVLSRMHIPEQSPDFLTQVLALGGLDYTQAKPSTMEFRQFTARIPLIAADAMLIPTEHKPATDDPLEQIQFVVFEPNKVSVGSAGLTTSLAGFYARTKSGKTIRTSTRHMEAKFINWEKATSDPIGLTTIMAPHASAITVSPMGIASIQFMGLGITSDFSVILNPYNPSESYLIEFQKDGVKNFYAIELPPHAPTSASWVVAYSDQFGRSWQPLEVSVQ